jgi:hypothetical protein
MCLFQVGEAPAALEGGEGAGPARLVALGAEPDVANLQVLAMQRGSRGAGGRPCGGCGPAIRGSARMGNHQFMLSDGCLADERTRSRLGDDSLDGVLASLWPGDC